MPGNWHHIPFLRYLLPLVTGVMLALHGTSFHDWCYPVFFVVSGIYFAIGLWLKWKIPFRWQIAGGLLLQVMFFFGGMALLQYQTPWWKADYFMNGADSNTVFVCRLIKPPDINEKSIKLEMQVEGRWDESNFNSTSGNTIVYLRKDSLLNNLPAYGDYALIPNVFTSPAPPKNPNTFDFNNYLRGIGVAHIAMVSSDEVWWTGAHKKRIWWQWIFKLRDDFHHAVINTIKDADAQTVGEALVIGTKTDIDADVQQAYANTGTLHVLAVSGLHVGILFAVLELLLSPIPFFKKSQKGKVIKFFLVILVIWWYACLSGLSASVNRSAVMFTCLATGKLFDRENHTFNILFVSMFILVLFDPRCITQVGFQLSYLAVGGIVYFQPYLQRVWRPKNRLLKHIWSMCTVSIAAQIATSPISLFYFHQFPNYFLLSNMLAIPISFVVLILGLLFFVMHGIPYVGNMIGIGMEYSLRLLNGSVKFVDDIPGSVVQNIYCSDIQIACMYGIVFCIGVALASKKGRFLVIAVFFCVAIGISGLMSHTAQMKTDRLVCYQLRHHSAILLQHGGTSLVLSDTLMGPASSDWTNVLRNDALTHGDMPDFALFGASVPSTPGSGIIYEPPWLLCGDMAMFILDSTSVHQLPKTAPEADLVYILGNPYLNLPDLTERFPKARVVIGGNTDGRRHSYYLRTCRKLEIPVVSLRYDGALVLE